MLRAPLPRAPGRRRRLGVGAVAAGPAPRAGARRSSARCSTPCRSRATRSPAADIDLALRAIAEEDGPSLSSYVKVSASLDEVREFLVHRSAYQLKEADPHSWAIPRLSGPPKAALIEIQSDEYGGGRAEWIHAELFARAMRALGLDSDYGAYLELIPGITLATVNLMSLFGLHRRWRGAIVGHLALFEMTSSIPNRRYADGSATARLRRRRDAVLRRARNRRRGARGDRRRRPGRWAGPPGRGARAPTSCGERARSAISMRGGPRTCCAAGTRAGASLLWRAERVRTRRPGRVHGGRQAKRRATERNGPPCRSHQRPLRRGPSRASAPARARGGSASSSTPAGASTSRSGWSASGPTSTASTSCKYPRPTASGGRRRKATPGEADLIVSIGGDGTTLAALRSGAIAWPSGPRDRLRQPRGSRHRVSRST